METADADLILSSQQRSFACQSRFNYLDGIITVYHSTVIRAVKPAILQVLGWTADEGSLASVRKSWTRLFGSPQIIPRGSRPNSKSLQRISDTTSQHPQ
jgi:hypothetical protein